MVRNPINMSEQIKPCHFIIDYDVPSPPSSSEIASLLEKGSQEEKLDALKTLILMILQDEHFPRMIMTVVQHALRVDSKEMKKLLLLYWEAIEKTNPDGSIKDEMVLLCNAIRNDLLSPNEFVRARTLRLVAKMRYRDMLDSLLQPVLECLSHRHPYVRRNAVMCVYSIHMKFGEELMPDAVTQIEELLSNETDLSAKRNSLLFLFEASPTSALKYLESVFSDQDEASNVDILQLVVLDELKKVSRANPLEKGKHMKSIFKLAASTRSQSVLFECASTITQLTRHPSAIKLAVSSYVKLLTDRSADSNVKLIVLERLTQLQGEFGKILQDQSADLLRVLTDSSNDIRKCCLDLVLQMLAPKNIEDILRVLKKELVSVQTKKEEAEYQELLIEALHKCAVAFPDITGQLGLVEILMDCCLLQAATAEDVSFFIQQLVVTYESFRHGILTKVDHVFTEIQNPQVYRTILWILAEYSESPSNSIRLILKAVGEGPFINKHERALPGETQGEEEEVKMRTVILPDGTYGTQIVSTPQVVKNQIFSGLRNLITEVKEVDYFLITAIAVTLTKLFFKCTDQATFRDSILLMLCQIIQVRSFPKKCRHENAYSEIAQSIDPDNFERVLHCIQTLTGLASADWINSGKELYKPTLSSSLPRDQQEKESQMHEFDELIAIGQLKGRSGVSDLDIVDDSTQQSLLGNVEDYGVTSKNIQQLTGLGDTVYVECILKFQHFDVVLEFLVFNKSQETLQNMTLELAAQGDLKIVERPQPCSLGPQRSVSLKASVKVGSTEAGLIFGNLTFDAQRGGTLEAIAFNPIHIDTVEYIQPAFCTDAKFRKMWQQLKWETAVPVFSYFTNPTEFVKKIAALTNMQVLTPDRILNSNQAFLVGNLYAQSRFAEDALANVSLERHEQQLVGTIRIRAKSEGMAKCLGERMSICQQQLK